MALVVSVVALGGTGTSLALTMGNEHPERIAIGSREAPKLRAGSEVLCPLTGQPAPSGKVPQRPALAIKVDNYPDARPQSGLLQADVVFEEPVEGGITRLVAVFQCHTASLVGPIRSARAVDAQILDELSDPVFVHVGGIPPVLSLVADADDTDEDVSNTGPPVVNPPGRYAPYDTYLSTTAGWGLDPTDTTPPAPLFTYSPVAPQGTAVSTVHIPYSETNDVLWTWDPGMREWMLSYGGSPATVANGDQIGVQNIVVQSVQVTYGPWVENSEGALEVQSQLTGSGPLMVFRNGTELTGTWERSSLDQATTLMGSNGSTIALEPGRTWIEIVPSSVPVTTTSAHGS